MARMTFEEREKIIDLYYSKCKELMRKKGPGYTKEGLANDNFWNGAEKYGITPLKALGVHMSKHTNSIELYIKKDGEKIVDPEPIEQRIIDHINYNFILISILIELGKIQHPGRGYISEPQTGKERPVEAA